MSLEFNKAVSTAATVSVVGDAGRSRRIVERQLHCFDRRKVIGTHLVDECSESSGVQSQP